MPHQRLRYASKKINAALKYSPIVGLLGQRQVGKTTLLESHCNAYRTFDSEITRIIAEEDPQGFLISDKFPLGIDEAQYCPRLFPALKEHVRKNQKPGQFLLSGSVRFTSRKAIRESLTGRIVYTELLPFTVSEAHGTEMSNSLLISLRAKDERSLEKLGSFSSLSEKSAIGYLENGGLPGICFYRKGEVRAEKFSAQIDTQLSRDFFLVQKTSLSYDSLRTLLSYIANNQGEEFELKKASSESQISTLTLKKVLNTFEALFLIRKISTEGDEKKPTYFLEDQGMASWLMRNYKNQKTDIVRVLYANLRQEFFYNPELNGSITQFRSRNGVIIPLIFRSVLGCLGIIAIDTPNPNKKTLSGAFSFLRRNPNSKIIIASPKNSIEIHSENIFQVPYWKLL